MLQGMLLGEDNEVVFGESRVSGSGKEGKGGAETAGWGWRRFCIIEQPGKHGGEGARAEQSKAPHKQALFTVRSTESQQVTKVPPGKRPAHSRPQNNPKSAATNVNYLERSVNTARGILAGLASLAGGVLCWAVGCGVCGECNERASCRSAACGMCESSKTASLTGICNLALSLSQAIHVPILRRPA